MLRNMMNALKLPHKGKVQKVTSARKVWAMQKSTTKLKMIPSIHYKLYVIFFHHLWIGMYDELRKIYSVFVTCRAKM